jgi:DNA adenine methylase
VSYPGGKGAAGVVQTIINQQPPHRWYIEPFLGGGAVMRAKLPADLGNEGLDLNPDPLVKFDDRARWPYPKFQFHNGCGISFLSEVGGEFDSETLIYCDPPYPLAARRRNRRLYRCELEDADHVRLLTVLASLKCMVQISSYWNPLYASMLERWRLIRFQAMTRGGLMEECLWMNFPEPAALHDYRYLGSDFRERERIRRKTQRWTARIASLPELERLALHSALASTIAKNTVAGSGDTRRPKPAFPAVIDCAPSETAVLQ